MNVNYLNVAVVVFMCYEFTTFNGKQQFHGSQCSRCFNKFEKI